MADFVVSSTSFALNGSWAEKHFWNQFGCTGGNVSPQLSWSGAPEGTKSFAITLYDPDAPTGSGFWHWVSYNWPASAASMAEGDASSGKFPAGVVEGNTDLGKPGWFGPCPPPGRVHHYIYSVHALKVEKLDVPPGATAAMTGFFLWMNTIAKATLTGTAGPRKP